MNRPLLIRLAMTGALTMGLAFAQTSTTQKPATAQPSTQTPSRPQSWAFHRNMHQRLMQELALSPAQKAQAKQIFQQVRTADQPIRAQLRDSRQALAAAIKSDDTAQIRQITQARASLIAKVMTSRSEAMAKFYATLTPEQKAKADQIHQRMEQRIQQRRAQVRTNG